MPLKLDCPNHLPQHTWAFLQHPLSWFPVTIYPVTQARIQRLFLAHFSSNPTSKVSPSVIKFNLLIIFPTRPHLFISAITLDQTFTKF